MMDEILKITQGQPFIVVLLLLAVYWMTRNNADLITRLHAERTHRLDRLEEAIAECERDRKNLWERIANHDL
jgi:hypothetical protein